MRTGKTSTSTLEIRSEVENTWDKITNVEIEHFRFPWYFRIMNIPKPIRASILREGAGGSRIAFFDNGKRFVQQIESWEKYETYSFTFNAEDSFKAAYFFDLFKGIFQLKKGAYFITETPNGSRIELRTDYEIHSHLNWLFEWPVHFILNVFQKYLLNTIKITAETDSLHTKQHEQADH